MISVVDQILDQLAWTGGSQYLGVILLLKHDSPVVYHNPVTLSLVMHVGVVTGPVDVEQQSVVSHLTGLNLLVSPIELHPVALWTRLGAGN